MRAPRRSLVVRGLVAVLAVGAWIAAALLLWRTSVPPLDLDGFDERSYFGARALSRAHDYEQGMRLIWLLSTVATIAVLVVLVRVLPRSARGIGAGRIGTAVVLGMQVLVATWLVALPFRIAALWWRHHWGLGPFHLWTWFYEQRWGLVTTALVAVATIAVLVALATRFPRTWWIPGGAAFVAVVAAVVFASGWIDASGTKAVSDPRLKASIERISHDEGVSPPVRVKEIRTTDTANAFAVGFGPSTHVVVWDTLLDGRFSDGEIDAVLAHELAHVERRHVLKGIAWAALFAFPALLAVALVTGRRGGLREPANVPLAVLVLLLAWLAVTPIQNAVSRRYEAEADWRALQTTRDPASARRLFEGFQRTSLQQPSPPGWAYVWLETHPTLMQRIAMAERFEEAHGSH